MKENTICAVLGTITSAAVAIGTGGVPVVAIPSAVLGGYIAKRVLDAVDKRKTGQKK